MSLHTVSLDWMELMWTTCRGSLKSALYENASVANTSFPPGIFVNTRFLPNARLCSVRCSSASSTALGQNKCVRKTA